MTNPRPLINLSLFILVIFFTSFTAITINDDKCQNPKYIAAESEARTERNKKVNEIEDEHSTEVDGIQHVKSALLMEQNDVYRSELVKCSSTDAACHEKAETNYNNSVKEITHKYDSLLKDAQENEYKEKEAAQKTYIEAINKARDLYPNSYEVEKDPYYSGKICNVRKPFEITVTNEDLHVKVPFKFVPETDSAGSVSFGFTYQIATTAGGGKYTITGLNTCHPSITITGGMTTQGGGLSHGSSGVTNIKLFFIEDCGQ